MLRTAAQRKVAAMVLVTVLCVLTSAAQNSGDPKAKVSSLEAQWLEAQKTSNPALLEPLLAETFFNVSTDSTVSDKAETLRLVKAAKYAVAEYLDVKVTVYGSTAIASGIFHGKAANGSEVRERWTDTWVKTGKDAWQCVASHASPMKSS